MRVARLILLAVFAGFAACADTSDPASLDTPLFGVDESDDDDDDFGEVEGEGTYTITLNSGLVLTAHFEVEAEQTGADESAEGTFHHRTELGGEAIDFDGILTCMSIDADEGRAWIGGIVTRNRSVREPFASGEIYQPGRDIWFRVLDLGDDSDDVDRTTFVGFEGGAGIITSKEYCDTRPWPDDNARTNPVIEGEIEVEVEEEDDDDDD